MFDISIIIPVYNSKSTLKDAVESVLKQKFKRFKPKIEIILSIDDCQNYKKIIFTKKENINIKHIQTRIIRSGPGHARNIGFKYSSDCKTPSINVGFSIFRILLSKIGTKHFRSLSKTFFSL